MLSTAQTWCASNGTALYSAAVAVSLEEGRPKCVFLRGNAALNDFGSECTTSRRTASVRPFVICAQMPLNPSSRVPPAECKTSPGTWLLPLLSELDQTAAMPNLYHSGVCPCRQSTPISVSSKHLRGCETAQSVTLVAVAIRAGIPRGAQSTLLRPFPASLPRCRCRLCS
jgi:hypothetical protein